VLGLRRFRDRTTADALARDHGISRATAYRYLEEVILVLAAQAPNWPRRWNGPGTPGSRT
jgi:response regulator of citrate/malate metabolism